MLSFNPFEASRAWVQLFLLPWRQAGFVGRVRFGAELSPTEHAAVTARHAHERQADKRLAA